MKNKYRTKYVPKHDQDTFLQVVKTSGFFVPGSVYTLVEFPDEQRIAEFLCVHVRVIDRDDLTPEIAFLDSNCDLDIFQEILDNRGLATDDKLTIVTFTKVHNSRKHYAPAPTEKDDLPKQKPNLTLKNPFYETPQLFV